MKNKVSVVIPAYNEQEGIQKVLRALNAVFETIKQPHEIIVIDDGSTDGTGEKAGRLGASVITHKKNLGYGRSLKDAIRKASGEIILTIDADGTYEVEKIPEMLRLIGGADMVIGKRIFEKGKADRFKNLTRRFFAYLTSYYGKRKIEDLNSGQRAFRRSSFINKLDKFPDGFSFSSTMTVLNLLEGKKIIYTPVIYRHREKGSKFKACRQLSAIANLAFKLTFMARPIKLTLQMAGVFAGVVLSARIVQIAWRPNFFILLLSFLISYLVFFLFFLSYIYFRGRSIVGQKEDEGRVSAA